MIAGLDGKRSVDGVFINSPLKNYDLSRRNDFTLPVLGLGYIATYCKAQGFNVGVLDAESLGLGLRKVAAIVNRARPRWVGLNLLAPTYRFSVQILQLLDPNIQVMLGGHQAKAMPDEILADVRIPRINALILGEGEYRAAEILKDRTRREVLPNIKWRDDSGVHLCSTRFDKSAAWLSPDINTLPALDRGFLADDPFRADDGRMEANMVGSRGCPYNCSFCGAALSANPDVEIRTREPENILREMESLADALGVTVFRFVDDLFLANPAFIRRCMPFFIEHGVGDRYSWDATGRINVLYKMSDETIDQLKVAGCREVALGIESGSTRLLEYMGKKITTVMTEAVVDRLTKRGINVKGYFILGFPTETATELQATVDHISRLWSLSAGRSGTFRCSAFEFRPYPGTPEWARLLKTGRYEAKDLLAYDQIDLTGGGALSEMLDRDEFNFSVNLQFGDVPLDTVRRHLTMIMTTQKRMLPVRDHVRRSPADLALA